MFRFRLDHPAESELRRIAREQLARAIDELDNLPPAKAVHQARKRCKKLRGLIRLARPGMEDTYREENAYFRDAASGLSTLRDATVLIETYDKLLDHFADDIDRQPFGIIRRRLTERHQSLAEQHSDDRITDFRNALEASLLRVDFWTLSRPAVRVLLSGEQLTFRRARRARSDAYESNDAEAFHDWRKRVKYHGFHVRLLRDLWPSVLKQRARELQTLGDILGDDHDLAVLRSTLIADPERFGAPDDLALFLALASRRQNQLRRAARSPGKRLFAERRKTHTRRLRECWKTAPQP
ncbi:MAG: CHAD domain-containing protein [Chthoniobacterales bacterium]